MLPECSKDPIETGMEDDYIDTGNFIVVEDDDMLKELDGMALQLMKKTEDGHWECVKCAYRSKNKNHMKSHVEKHIHGYLHPCQQCTETYNTRKRLRYHMGRKKVKHI